MANGSDVSIELNYIRTCQQREYNCLNLKKCDERTNRQTDLCIELRYAQLINAAVCTFPLQSPSVKVWESWDWEGRSCPATTADPPRNSLAVAGPAVVSCPAHRGNALGRAAQVINPGLEPRPAQLVQQDWDSKWGITMLTSNIVEGTRGPFYTICRQVLFLQHNKK